MPIRNYTSTKDPSWSAQKMLQVLSEHGARRISMDYGPDGELQALTFMMTFGAGPLHFRIEPDPDGMLQAMEEDDGVPNSKCTEEQARRTAWRNKHDWLDAQLAEVAANQADMKELLLGFAVTDDGRTVYDRLQEEGHLLQSPHHRQLPPSE